MYRAAFISGITGQFFRQFALTISVSTIISAFNSLTLSPALTALLLRPQDKNAKRDNRVLPWPAYALAGGWGAWELLAHRFEPAAAGLGISATSTTWIVATTGAVVGALATVPANWLLGSAFRLFNRGFDFTGIGYTWVVGKMIQTWDVGLKTLPWLVCMAAGGWWAWEYLGPHLEIIGKNLNLPGKVGLWIGGIVGVFAGAAIAWPLNWLLEIALRSLGARRSMAIDKRARAAPGQSAVGFLVGSSGSTRVL